MGLQRRNDPDFVYSDSFDNAADRAMARLSEQYNYTHFRLPEPPDPTCVECDEVIEEDRYDDPMP